MVATIAPTQQEMMAWPYIGSDEESIVSMKALPLGFQWKRRRCFIAQVGFHYKHQLK